MKKIISILFTLIIGLSAYAQMPIPRSGSTITVVDDYVRAGKLSGLAIYSDTLVFTGHNGLDSVGSLIYVRSGADLGFWVREYNGAGSNKWNKVGSGSSGGSGIDSTSTSISGDTTFLNLYKGSVLVYSYYWQGDGTGGSGTLIPNGLTIPGIVTWSGTGLIMDIANPQYYFNQKFFSPASTQITLATADATYGRFDVIYVDSSGNIGSITGVPAVAPIIPQVDPQSQILLSSIYVAANATTPTQINQTLVYDENTEWGTSHTGTGVVNFNDVSNPYHGTKDIKVTSSGNGMALIFTSPTTDTSSISDVLKFFLYAPNDIPGGYSIQFFIGSQAASTALLINSNSYGFSNTHLGAYQNISIPLAAFTFLSPYYNSVRITTLAANTNPVYFDYMVIQHGNYNFTPTDYSSKVDSVSRVSGSDYWWAKGIPHLIGVAGGGGSYHLPYLGDSTKYLGSDTLYHALPTLIDTTNKWVQQVVSKDDSTITVIKNGTPTDIVIKGSAKQTVIAKSPILIYNKMGADPYDSIGSIQSGTASNGFLSSTDWNKFNNVADTGFRIITRNNLGSIGLPLTWRPNPPSGLLLRDTTSTSGNQPSPPIMFQGFNMVPRFYRTFYDPSNNYLRTQFSSDSINWIGAFYVDPFGNINTKDIAAGNLYGTGVTQGSSFYLIGGKFNAFGNGQMNMGLNTTQYNYNPIANITIADTTRGVLINRLTTTQKEVMTGNVYSGVITSGGSGYTGGTLCVGCAFTGGSGTGGTANFTTSGGVVTTVNSFRSGQRYRTGDVLSSALNGGGAGFTFTVTKVTGDTAVGLQVVDTTIKRSEIYNGKYWVGQGGLRTVTTTASAYTITNEDVIFVNYAGTATITLPSPVLANRPIWIRNLSATNTVTISGMGAGEPTSIAASGALQVTSDGTNFWVIGKY